MRKLLTIAAGILAACIATVSLAQNAPKTAGEKKPLTEIIVNDGVAFSWRKHEKGEYVAFDVVSAWQDTETGKGPSVADCNKFKTVLKGATWCFANEANLKMFRANTDKDGENSYLPLVGGRCALGASWGRLQASGDPRSARVIQGDLGPMLVLHSAEKWWPMFEKNMFTRIEIAKLRFEDAIEDGKIVPNDRVSK